MYRLKALQERKSSAAFCRGLAQTRGYDLKCLFRAARLLFFGARDRTLAEFWGIKPVERGELMNRPIKPLYVEAKTEVILTRIDPLYCGYRGGDAEAHGALVAVPFFVLGGQMAKTHAAPSLKDGNAKTLFALAALN